MCQNKRLEDLNQENLSVKTELKLQLDNIKLTINSGNNNRDTNILNSKNNNGSIKTQSTNISNISHGAVTVVEQNPDNSNLDFNVRDIAPSVPITLATPQNGRKKVKNSYCNTMQTLLQSNYSNAVSGNASNPLQPSVKHKNNPMGKNNLFIVGGSHIKRIERDLIVHHLSDKNIYLKCKNFDADRCWKDTAPSITFLAQRPN